MERSPELEPGKSRFIFLSGLARVLHLRRDGWRRDRTSMFFDGPGSVALDEGTGPEPPWDVLARIELNEKRGRPLTEGIDPDQLKQAGIQ